MKRIWLAVILLLVVVVSGLTIWLVPQSPVSRDIKKHVSFVIFVPGGDWKVERSDVSYDPNKKVLTINATNGGQKVTLNEQATPDPFNDIPGYYDKLVETLHSYAKIDTSIGKVNLTHPEELHGRQSAVSNNQGTLMFLSPNKDLSDDDWRRLFNTMRQVR